MRTNQGHKIIIVSIAIWGGGGPLPGYSYGGSVCMTRSFIISDDVDCHDRQNVKYT